jgi:hypothetical protein
VLCVSSTGTTGLIEMGNRENRKREIQKESYLKTRQSNAKDEARQKEQESEGEIARKEEQESNE